MRAEEVAAGPGKGAAAGDDIARNSVISPEALAAIERASAGDRAWFRRHPDRADRLRPTLRDEFPGMAERPGASRVTLVKRATATLRFRLAMWAYRWPCRCDGCLDSIWEQLVPEQYRETAVKPNLDIALRKGIQ